MSSNQRRKNIDNFRNGTYKYILVRDLFNEGIDIPETNMLVFMRCTQSPNVWLQQLGRGLRKHPGKDFVYVLDFANSPVNIQGQLVEKVNDYIAKEQEKGNKTSPKIEFYNKSSPITVGEEKPIEPIIKMVIADFIKQIEAGMPIPDPENIDDVVNPPDSEYDDTDGDFKLPSEIIAENGTYLDFLKENLKPEQVEQKENDYRKKCFQDDQELFNKNEVVASFKELSEESRYEKLLTYNEEQVKSLYGKIKSEERENNLKIQKKKSELIKKYGDVIKTRQDLLNLNPSDEEEIKQVFKCPLILFNRLESHRKQMGV